MKRAEFLVLLALVTGLLRPSAAIASETTFEDFRHAIETRGARSVEDAIALLPASMREGGYVLMYRSRSLQHASPLAPRAILTSPSARLIVTFNGGGAGVRGGDALEVVQFRDDTQSFEFREIVFRAGLPPRFSEPNPRKCLECHQSPARKDVDPRPNWEPYNIWPGAYGSDSGGLSNPLRENSHFMSAKARPQDREFLAEQAREKEYLEAFRKIANKHPRYRQLGAHDLRATVELTNRVASLNFMRVARLIRSSDRAIYETYLPLLELMIQCPYDPALAENALLQHHRQQSFARSPRYAFWDTTTLRLETIFEPLGIDTSDWSMDFRTHGRFAFYERFGAAGNTEMMLGTAWSKVIPASERLGHLRCEQLRPLVARSLQRYMKSGEPDRRFTAAKEARLASAPRADAVVARCARCHSAHSEAEGVPPIPFDDPEKLKRALSRPGSRHGSLFDEILYRTSDVATRNEQMPPSNALTSAERDALLGYLSGLR